MKLIGVAGTNGSGKDTVGDMLAERHGFLFVSVSDLLRQEAKKRGQPIERQVLRTISAEWRREFGLGVLVDKAIEQYKAGDYQGLVAIPMRNTGEAQHLKDLGGTLVWVDADPRVRYDRIWSRQRTAEDNKSFEEFVTEEQAEMHRHSSADSATLDVAAVKGLCDIFLQNNGNNIEAFKNVAEQQLRNFL